MTREIDKVSHYRHRARLYSQFSFIRSGLAVEGERVPCKDRPSSSVRLFLALGFTGILDCRGRRKGASE
jgi:hypothetical protein